MVMLSSVVKLHWIRSMGQGGRIAEIQGRQAILVRHSLEGRRLGILPGARMQIKNQGAEAQFKI